MDLAGIAGFLVTIVGFAATLLNVVRARNAAEQARDASERARDEVRRAHTTIELAQVVLRMEELKRLHREGLWQALPDCYSQLQRDLISIRHRSPHLTETQAARMQNGIVLLAKLEADLDKSLASGRPPVGIARPNRLISQHMADLLGLLHELEAYGDERS